MASARQFVQERVVTSLVIAIATGYGSAASPHPRIPASPHPARIAWRGDVRGAERQPPERLAASVMEAPGVLDDATRITQELRPALQDRVRLVGNEARLAVESLTKIVAATVGIRALRVTARLGLPTAGVFARIAGAVDFVPDGSCPGNPDERR